MEKETVDLKSTNISRVPAAPRACSKRSAACNTLAKGKPAEKHQPDGAVPASTRAQVSGSPRH